MATKPLNPFGQDYGGDFATGVGPGPELPIKVPTGDWFEGLGAAVALQPFWQAASRTYDKLTANEDPNFSAFQGNYLKGYEDYQDQFLGTRSKMEGDRLKLQIDANLQRRRLVNDNLGFWGQMASELVNPVNYIPLPGLAGAGFVKGALRAGTAGLALQSVSELTRLAVDPTATTEESVDNVVYGTLFQGLLGGVVGMVGAKDMARISRGFADYNNALDRSARYTPDIPAEANPITSAGTIFQAVPTGEARTGVKPAFGLEKQTETSFWGRLKAMPVRAINDFADAMLGDFGTMSARNMQNLPTHQSVLLAATRWHGEAGDLIQNLQKIYANYLSDNPEGSGGFTVFGMSPARLLPGSGRPEGKMSYNEFLDTVFRAHAADAQIDDPFVQKAFDATRHFYDTAMEDGLRTGAIGSREGEARTAQRKVGMIRSRQARLAELQAIKGPSVAQRTEMIVLARLQRDELDKLSRGLDRGIAYDDPELQAKLDEIDVNAAQRLNPQATRDEILAGAGVQRQSAQQYLDDINASIDTRIEKDRAILAHLDQVYAERGLNDRQLAYRDDLAKRLSLLDEGVRGTAKQDAAIEALKAKLGEAAPGAATAATPEDIKAYVDATHLDYDQLSPAMKKWVDDNQAAIDAELMSRKGEKPTGGSLLEQLGGENLSQRDRIVLKSVDEINKLVERYKDDPTFKAETQGTMPDWDRGRARVVDAHMDELPQDVQEFLATQKAFDQETGETHLGVDGIHGTHMFNLYDEADQIAQHFEKAPPAREDVNAFLSDKQRAYLDNLDERIAKGYDFEGPPNEKNYINRVWDLDKVVADEAGPKKLRQTLTDWFTTNPLPGASTAPQAIAVRVDEAIKSILKEAQTGDLQVKPPSGGTAFASRRINIPNANVVDFLDTNIDSIARTYSTRFGVSNELARMFGSVDAQDGIDETVLQAIREMNFTDDRTAMAQVDSLYADLTHARDKLTGAVYSSDPAMMNQRRLVGGAKGLATLMSLGKVASLSLVELGRASMVLGFRRTFSHALQMLENPDAVKAIGGELRRVTGEGLDTLMTGMVDRWIEHGGPQGQATGLVGKAAGRVSAFSHGPFMLATLLPLLTDFQKRMNLSFINHFLMQDIHAAADGTASAKAVRDLASYGISLDDAKAIVTQPIQRNGQFYLPNMGDWSDANLAIRYAGAVNGLSRRIITTPGQADIPEFAKGFVKGREYPLLTLPTQFMNYGFGAANKVLLSALQGRDQNAMAGAALLLGLGYLVARFKASDNEWNKATLADKTLRAVDASGLTAVYSNASTMIETASLGNVGIRPMLGMDPFIRQPSVTKAIGQTVGGVVGSKIADIADLYTNPQTSASDVASVVRRSVPLNNLFYWDWLWKDVQRAIVDPSAHQQAPPPPPG